MHWTLAVARSIALLLVGLYTGGVVFIVLAPSAARLPGPTYVGQWQALNKDYSRAMPLLLLTTVAALIVTTVLSWHRGQLVVLLDIAAVLLVVLTIVLTVAAMEPLNRLANSWNPDRLPDVWDQTRQRWIRLHLARTVMALAAFACALVAAAVDR